MNGWLIPIPRINASSETLPHYRDECVDVSDGLHPGNNSRSEHMASAMVLSICYGRAAPGRVKRTIDLRGLRGSIAGAIYADGLNDGLRGIVRGGEAVGVSSPSCPPHPRFHSCRLEKNGNFPCGGLVALSS